MYWMYAAILFLSVGNPLLFWIYFLLVGGVNSKSFLGFTPFYLDASGLMFISLPLFAVFALVIYTLWCFLQKIIVEYFKAVSLDTYFRTKFWILAILPIAWQYVLIYGMATGMSYADFQSLYSGVSSFFACWVLFIYIYHFRISVFKGELD